MDDLITSKIWAVAMEAYGPGCGSNAMHRALSAALPLIRAGVVEDDRHGFGDLVASAYAEADKAMRKFPQPNYVISKVAEEAGEVVKAAIHCAESRETATSVAGEMKQLIAMLYRLWVEGDQVHGLHPVAAALPLIRAGVVEEAAVAVEQKAKAMDRRECCGVPGNPAYECCGDPIFMVSDSEAAATIRAMKGASHE